MFQPTTTIKKGTYRKSKKPAVVEIPGNPVDPGSFLNIESNEQKLAAYLGYGDVCELRRLAMSWPVLAACIDFEKIATNMNKKTAMLLIYDGEEEFKDVDSMAEWPLEEAGTEDEKRNMKARHLACILLRLESNILEMGTMDRKKNEERQQSVSSTFTKDFPGVVVPRLGYPPQDPQEKENAPEIRPPTLAFMKEHRMESINRCWNLLKYFRYTRQAASWESKFSQDGVQHGSSIHKSYVPHWLLPDEKIEATFAIRKSAAVLEADHLAPKPITVIWDITEFDGKEDLDDALTIATAKNMRIPDSKQTLMQDPRLSTSAAAFRDAIRRQYNCQQLLIDIRSIKLRYTNMAYGNLTKDILHCEWKESKSTFLDDENSNLVLHVSFEALDNPEQNIFESFEPPPQIAEYFDIESSDVAMNNLALTDAATNAFGAEQATEAIEPQLSGTSKSNRELPSSVEIAFSAGRGADDIGSAPDPREKFPAQKDFEALLEYYDNFDVTSEEGRRKWQLEVLGEITSNARVASVKLDKLSKSISIAQKRAIEEGELLGQYAAMGEEAKERRQEGMI
jgi:hypothetical protein